MHTIDTNTREVIAGLEAEIARHEEQTATLGRVIFDADTELQHHKNRAAMLNRLVEQLRRTITTAHCSTCGTTGVDHWAGCPSEPAGHWGTVLVEDLCPGDTIVFDGADCATVVRKVNRNQDGRIVVTTTTHVRVFDDDVAVRVRYPREPNAGLTFKPPAGVEVVYLGAQPSTVAELHEAIAEHVAEPETAGVGR